MLQAPQHPAMCFQQQRGWLIAAAWMASHDTAVAMPHSELADGTLAVDRPSFVIGAPARMAFSLVALVIVMKDPACERHAAVSHRLSDHSA